MTGLLGGKAIQGRGEEGAGDSRDLGDKQAPCSQGANYLYVQTFLLGICPLSAHNSLCPAAHPQPFHPLSTHPLACTPNLTEGRNSNYAGRLEFHSLGEQTRLSGLC